MIEQRPARVLPIDYGEAADPHTALDPPLVESTWIEPYPDAQLGLTDALAGPEARYAQREAVELAFNAALDERLPDRSQQATLRLLGDEELSATVNRFVDAWSRADVDSIAELLTDTAILAMPPTATWFRGRDTIAAFLRRTALDGTRSWRMLPTSANGQPAMGAYMRDESGAYRPYGVTVLTLGADGIAEINTFRDPSAPDRFGLPDEA